VSNVAIERVALRSTNTPLQAAGFGAGKLDGAITASHAPDLRIDRVDASYAGGHGICVSDCPDARISACIVHGAGAGGIYASGDGAHVEDCIVEDIGRDCESAIGIRASGGMRVAHNAVSRTPYSALCAAGGRETVIEKNRFKKAMQVLHDGAAIYVTFCKNYVLRCNVVSDIAGYAREAYYLDEQAEGCLVEGNLSFNCPRPSHNHMARRNTIRNNVFVHDGDLTLTFPKCEDFIFERNVLRAEGDILFQQFDAIQSMPKNVIYSGTGSVKVAHGTDYAADEPEPFETREGTILADPMLVNVRSGDCRFRTESPAHGQSIEPLHLADAGPRG
jgi:hypothetical protein